MSCHRLLLLQCKWWLFSLSNCLIMAFYNAIHFFLFLRFLIFYGGTYNSLLQTNERDNISHMRYDGKWFLTHIVFYVLGTSYCRLPGVPFLPIILNTEWHSSSSVTDTGRKPVFFIITISIITTSVASEDIVYRSSINAPHFAI